MREQEIFDIIKENLEDNGIEVSDSQVEDYVQQFLNEVEEQEIDDDENIERQLQYFVTSLYGEED
jgi:hypothetical protein